MAQIIGWIFLATLMVLSAGEWRRYRRAREAAGDAAAPNEMEYPRRRLSRRIGVAGLLGVAIGLAAFMPSVKPWFDLGLLVVVAVLLAVAIKLLARDLRETSEATMEYSRQMTRATRESIERLIKEEPGKTMERTDRESE